MATLDIPAFHECVAYTTQTFDQRHDEQARDEAEHVEATAGLIECLRCVCHAPMERWDIPRRHG